MDAALLQYPQQAGLGRQRHVADLVQKQDALVGFADQPRAAFVMGASECALFVAKGPAAVFATQKYVDRLKAYAPLEAAGMTFSESGPVSSQGSETVSYNELLKSWADARNTRAFVGADLSAKSPTR